MNLRKVIELTGLLIAILVIDACSKKDNPAPTPELSVSSSEELFTADAGTSEVTVTSNTKWNINNTAAWVAVTPSTGDGNGKISLNVQANQNTSERSVIIAVTAGNISISVDGPCTTSTR